jgi:hypothetical protein
MVSSTSNTNCKALKKNKKKKKKEKGKKGLLFMTNWNNRKCCVACCYVKW